MTRHPHRSAKLMAVTVHPVIRPVWALCAAALLLPATVLGQEDSAENRNPAEVSDAIPATGETVPIGNEDTLHGLPRQLPNGQRLRTIGLYQSQAPELIPDDYRPLSLNRLKEGISRLTELAADDVESRLGSAVYWVRVQDDMLISQRSTIDIESDKQGLIRRSLGTVNLAIAQPNSWGVASSDLPRLESDPNGELVAVFLGDDSVRPRIEFQWQFRGSTSGSGHEFQLQLPRTPQTRIVLMVPQEVTLTALDGILRRRPDPPPDAIETGPNATWYELDAGGLATVRLRTDHAERALQRRDRFIVRRSSIRYFADLTGLTWNCRMIVQLPSDQPFPPIEITGTNVTSIEIDGIDVPYTVRNPASVTDPEISVDPVRVDILDEPLNPASSFAIVTVNGISPWRDAIDWCDMPIPRWIGEHVVHASSVDSAMLSVADPLQLISWELPPDWMQTRGTSPAQSASDDPTEYYANGPSVWVATEESATDAASTWSRVRLFQRPSFRSASTALRLEMSQTDLKALARTRIAIDRSRIEPIRMKVQQGWSIDSVAFPRSGRIIEKPTTDTSSGQIVVWPDIEDVEGAEIVIETTGSRPISDDRTRLTIPSSWFLKVADVPSDLVAAIVPPAQANWGGDAALHGDQIQASELAASDQEFFDGLDERTLYFTPVTGRTPRITLQESVSFNTSSALQLMRDSDEVVEELLIEIDTQRQSLEQLVIESGPANGRPPLQWSLSDLDDGTSTGFSTSEVSVSDDGVYTIQVSDKNLRGRRLIARRRYPLDEPIEIQLPSVRGAVSQQSDVFIHSGFLVKDSSQGVQRIPMRYRNVVHLRYNPVDPQTITIATADIDPNLTVVWREEVRVVASSRGTDQIQATFRVSATSPLTIDHDPELQLVAIVRNGAPVNLMSIEQRPIRLPPTSSTETITITWRRSQYGASWIRSCRMPKIRIFGTVLKSEYRLVPSTDTFAPTALIAGDSTRTAHTNAVALSAGDNVTLVRRNVALAIGWLVALIVFSTSWYLARIAPVSMACSVVLCATVLFLWWPWRLAIIGWLIVPIVAAMLLTTSRAWSGVLHGDQADRDDRDSTRSVISDLSSDFSFSDIGRLMLALAATLATPALICHTSTAADVAEKPPVNVLVTLDAHGKHTDGMVYIPKSTFTELFPRIDETMPENARIQWARYRLQVASTPDAPVSLESEYLIRIDEGDRSTNLVRLPLDFTSVRRIAVIDEGRRICRFSKDEDGNVVARLPRGDVHRIVVTLIPAAIESTHWTSVALTIPRIASSRLIVESTQSIDALRVGGKLLAENVLQWTEEIGPIANLRVQFKTGAKRQAEASQTLQNRFWIQASRRQITIDCEIDPPDVMTAGEQITFVVRDAEMPTLTSRQWSLISSESTSTRQTITVASRNDAPGPIGLLWSRPSNLHSGDAIPIQIPDVLLSGQSAAVSVALHCDPALTLMPPEGESIDVLSNDQFRAQWSGHQSPIDMAYSCIDQTESPVLSMNRTPSPLINQRHELHVLGGQLELHFVATLPPDEMLRAQCRLRIPANLELVHATVDGRRLLVPPVPPGDEDTYELPLAGIDRPQPATIRAVAIQRLPPEMTFAPPRLSVFPSIPTEDRYTISRDRSTKLRVLSEPEKLANVQIDSVTDSMADGVVPAYVWTRRADGANLVDSPGGLFEVVSETLSIDCRQLIALSQESGNWIMDAHVRFDPNHIPEFVDVEVPTRWCGEFLDVDPPQWLQQPSTDPSQTVIRIRCDPDSMGGNNTVSIRGQLRESETGQVSVPNVKVLGPGSRQVHISVPSGKLIAWQESAVRSVGRLPGVWRNRVSESNRIHYVASDDSTWSIELDPLPSLDTKAYAESCDIQIFPRHSGALMLCHWDLIPGGRRYIDVRLPVRARSLGAWAGGQAIVAQSRPVQDPTPTVAENIYRIPLAVSRLSQSVDLLVDVPASGLKQLDTLPTLVDIRVADHWISRYAATSSPSVPARENSEAVQARLFALAESVVESIDSADAFAQVPRGGKSAWMELWLARYRMIAESAGHVVDLESSNIVAADGDTIDRSSPPPASYDWDGMDRRIGDFARRYLTVDSTPVADSGLLPDEVASSGANRAILFAVADFDGFVADHVSRLSTADRPRSVPTLSMGDGGLRNLLFNLLSILLVAGALLSLRPVRHLVEPLIMHPAFWLAVLAIFGFEVAPVPVAAALLGVTVCLAALPRKHQIRQIIGLGRT